MEYTINAPNGDIKINVPGGWATEETLKKLVKVMAADKVSTGKVNKNLKDLAQNLDKNNRSSLTSQLVKTTDDFEDLSDELTNTEKGLKSLGTALETVGGVASGVLQGTGKLTDIIPVVDSVSGAINRLGEKIEDQPFVGIIGKFLTAGTQLSRNFLEIATIYGQQVIDTFDNLVGSGVGVQFNFDDLGETVAEAKIGQEALNEVVRQNSAGLIAFGGDLENGVTRFLEITSIANNSLREEFRSLGMSTQETAEFIGDFIDTSRIGLLQTKLTNQEAADAALSLSREMQLLAELTGQDVDAIQKEVFARNIAVGNQNKLARLQMEGMEGAVESFALLKASVPDAVKPVVDQLLQFDAALADQAPLNAFPGLVGNLNKGIDDIFSDKTLSLDERNARVNKLVEQVQNDMVDIAEGGQMGQLGELAGLLGDATLDTFGAVLNDAFQIRALTLGRDLDVGETQVDLIRQQQQETLTTIQQANGVIGSLMQSVMAIEDARSEFEAALLSQAKNILPEVGVAITTFYQLLAAPFGIDLNPNADEPNVPLPDVGFDVRPGDTEGAQQYYQDMGIIPSNYTGGSIMPNTVSMVGEMGPELIKSGSQGGEVINNATTEKIMGAANAVVNNIGNDGSDVLKQISDILNQSNAIQSNILKETRRSKGFQY